MSTEKWQTLGINPEPFGGSHLDILTLILSDPMSDYLDTNFSFKGPSCPDEKEQTLCLIYYDDGHLRSFPDLFVGVNESAAGSKSFPIHSVTILYIGFMI